MKKGILTAAGLVLLGSIAIVSYGGNNFVTTLHTASHKFGLCQVADAAPTFASADRNSAGACVSNTACKPENAAATLAGFSEAERKLIDYVCDRVVDEGKTNFDDVDFEKEVGVSVEGVDQQSLQIGVLAELNRRNFKFTSLGGGGYCSKFSACSVDRDLSGATGAELARYKVEKSEDSTVFTDWAAPDFTLPNTAGEAVSLSDYLGKPVALVFLAGHCSHSLDTLPILSELKTRYESDLVILPVYVNSGSVEDVNTWSSEMNLNVPLLVSQSKDIATAYGSRMVPSTFLINREGRITKKYVGYKDQAILDQAFAELIRSQGV